MGLHLRNMELCRRRAVGKLQSRAQRGFSGGGMGRTEGKRRSWGQAMGGGRLIRAALGDFVRDCAMRDLAGAKGMRRDGLCESLSENDEARIGAVAEFLRALGMWPVLVRWRPYLRLPGFDLRPCI